MTLSLARVPLMPVAVLAGLIGLSALAGMVALSRLKEIARAGERVSESHRILRSLDRGVILLGVAEADLRDFLLTDDPAFGRVVAASASRTEREVDEFIASVRSAGREPDRPLEFQALVRERLGAIRRDVEMIGPADVDRILAPSRAGDGTSTMSAVRRLADSIRATEESKLTWLEQRARQARDMGQAVFGAILVLVVGAGCLAVLNILDASRRAKRMQAAMTEREAAEERVRARERELVALANSMPQLVWAAGATGEYDYLNQRWYDYTGMSTGAAPSKWQEVVHPDDMEHTIKVWTCCLESGEPYQVEYRLRRADGSYRWFMGRAVPLRAPDGSIVRWFGTSTDIDEEKRVAAERETILESERAARGDAERANRLKDEFVATISHELRTPLNAVLGWVRILRRDPSRATLEQGLEVIERNARTQARLVDDLLETSRAMSGKLRLDITAVHLASAVQAAVETIRPAAAAKGVGLEVTLESGLPPIAADSNRIQQVAWNLVSNAIKFTPRGGTVAVELKRLESSVRLTVTDSGMGMAAKFLPHVFDRFRQADATTTRQHGGLGLGLAIARHLVELHGGTIEAKSAGEGLGSTFVVELPISVYVPGAGRRAPADPDTLPKLDDAEVLIVDDDPDTRELVARLLQECGARTQVASSVAQALELYERSAPTVLVSDIGMPDEDGVDLIRRIRAIEAERETFTPAAALSALARREDRERALAAGFDVHLAKPVEPDALTEAVARLIQMSPRRAGERSATREPT